MADLLKNTTEKKNTKMVIISTSCFSLSQWAFSHLIIPATISEGTSFTACFEDERNLFTSLMELIQ